MPLFLVSRTDHTDYDEHDAAVIRAKDGVAALAIATSPTARDDGDGFKMPLYGFRPDGSNLKVERIDGRGKSGVILDSFNAG